MAERSVFYLVPAAHKDNANLVCAAMGLGPATFSVAASPTGNEPATHYFGHDATQSPELAAIFAAFPDNAGTLPEISGTWGQDGLPSQGLARAACAAMQVSVGSNIAGSDHRDGILQGVTLKIVVPEL